MGQETGEKYMVVLVSTVRKLAVMPAGRDGANSKSPRDLLKRGLESR